MYHSIRIQPFAFAMLALSLSTACEPASVGEEALQFPEDEFADGGVDDKNQLQQSLRWSNLSTTCHGRASQIGHTGNAQNWSAIIDIPELAARGCTITGVLHVPPGVKLGGLTQNIRAATFSESGAVNAGTIRYTARLRGITVGNANQQIYEEGVATVSDSLWAFQSSFCDGRTTSLRLPFRVDASVDTTVIGATGFLDSIDWQFQDVERCR